MFPAPSMANSSTTPHLIIPQDINLELHMTLNAEIYILAVSVSVFVYLWVFCFITNITNLNISAR